MIVLNGGNFIVHRITDYNTTLPANTLRNINGNWNSTGLSTYDSTAALRSYRPTSSTDSASGVSLICGCGTNDVSVNDYQLDNGYDST